MSHWTPVDAEGGMRHSNGPAAVRAGDFMFLSSVKGVDPGTQVADPGAVTQLGQAMANIEVVLQAGGLEMGDIVKITVFLEEYDENRRHLDEVWAATFASTTPPARVTVAIDRVGGSSDRSIALFDVVAYRPARA